MTQESLLPSDAGETPRLARWLTETALGMTAAKPLAEEIRYARAKYGLSTVQNPGMSEQQKLAILMEEVGEVARTIGDPHAKADPREVLQVCTVAFMWYDSLTRLSEPERNGT